MSSYKDCFYSSKKSSLSALLIMLLIIPIVSIAQVQTGSFVFEGYTRTYLVYLPPNYNGSDPLPVVFNLHGYTLNMTQQMNYSRMNTVADAEGFIAVYPNAAGAGWNAGINGFFSNINDVGFFNVLIDTLAEHYSIDLNRIYSCGFSLGGFMSNRLACELSNRIAAIATIAGLMGDSVANTCNPGHPVPVLSIHGTNDLLCPYNGAYDWLSVQELINHWNSYNLCTESDTTSLPDLDPLDGCTVQRINYTHCLDSTGITLFKVIQGGHTWPGGDTSWLHLSWGEIGKTNFDINASQEIWNFFKNTIKLNVNVPNGGEHWAIGDTVEIKWTGFRVDSIKIQLSVNNGISWTTISESKPSDGNYEWVVQAPDTSRECIMKISYEDDSSIFDESDASFYIDNPTSVYPSSIILPDKYDLHQNYPNPFNPSTTISWQLAAGSNATLKVYDILGKEIETLVNEEKLAGTYELNWNAANLPSGVYFYQLKAGAFVSTKKMILLK
ncbi:MAG: hypothetical protein A2W11_10640 [Ignavibacteria bacterium RBG_16_35_7]|nr:MAG: hypothetical protein A2W11_10640 [Ignavibacteria bacterium RBG_16_35_7]